MKKLFAGVLLLFIFLCSCFDIFAQTAITGYWNGAIVINGVKLEINLHVKKEGKNIKGIIDIPMQNANGLNLSNFKYTRPKVHFELETPGMPERLAVFYGELKNSLINGTFTQSGIKGIFSVRKSPDPEVSESVPYKQEEVSLKNGDITIAGTLTHPKSGVAPAVIMITGSGQQNRDEEIFGFKVFKIIADHFTRNGIAVLRMDDRGIGGTGGDPAISTTADFATDIQTAVDFLKARKDINKSQIGLMGHSEGALIAMMVASKRNDIDFLVLMSGAGIKGDSLITSQIIHSLKSTGANQAVIDQQAAIQRKVYEALRTDKGWDEVIAAFKEPFEKSYDKLSDNMKKQLPPKDEYLNKAIAGKLSQAKSPWFRYFIDADPIVYLEQIKCPVLMLFGGKDQQVFAEENQEAMVNALKRGGNNAYTVKIFPDANHIYQNAKTGSPQEYSVLPKEFVPGFLDFTTDWIKLNVRNNKSN